MGRAGGQREASWPPSHPAPQPVRGLLLPVFEMGELSPSLADRLCSSSPSRPPSSPRLSPRPSQSRELGNRDLCPFPVLPAPGSAASQPPLRHPPAASADDFSGRFTVTLTV